MAQHFYGCTAFNWAVGETREAVIAKLARDVGAQLIRRQVANQGGVYVWTCVVEADIKASYDIENYCPKGVKWHGAQEHRIQNARGAFVAEAPRVAKEA
jgi:hypothetical protein